MFLNKIFPFLDVQHKASVAAFALVSFADGELHVSELNRFLRIMHRDNPGMIVDENRLTRDVIAFGKKLALDFAGTKIKALEALSRVKDDKDATAQIMKICNAVMISDQKTSPSEEAAVAEIAATLGRQQFLP